MRRFLTWQRAIAEFIADKRAFGDFSSPLTDREYRDTLETLSEYAGGRTPHSANRDDVKHCLARWAHPNTRRTRRAQMVSFFDWMVEEDLRDANPARATRKIRAREPEVIRWTLGETRAFLAAAITPRERRVAFLGVGQGLRNAELRALTGESFARPGFVKVIGKGQKVRWLPVLEDVQPVVDEIRRDVGRREFVIPAMRPMGAGRPQRVASEIRSSSESLARIVEMIAARAGLGHATPHVMRRAFADFVWGAGENLRLTQHLLGHSNPATTNTYLSKLSPERLAASVEGLRFGLQQRPGEAVTSVGMSDGAVRPVVDADARKTLFGGALVSERVFVAAWFAEAQLLAARRGDFYRAAA